MIEYVIKRDERKEPFDADKLNNWAQWGEKTVNPKDFNWSGIVLRTVSLLGKECTTKELQDTLIKECLNQNTWESNRMAGRLYASALSKELYEIRKHPHIKELHDKLINLGIVIKPNYTNEEYEYINKLLNHKRDFTYSHYAINQLVQKYSLRDRIKKVSYETPQFIYMRVAMDTLNFYTKEDRLEKLKDLYEELSFQRVVVPTPYFANSLTRNPNKISCSVITCTDEAESIGVLNTLAYTLTTSGAGVGAHMKTRSINDPVRGGLVKHAGKVPYYRAFANIMKSSTQGCYDPETEVLTEEGWKFFKDITEEDLIVQVNDDLSVEAIKPTRIIAYNHTGIMYQFGMNKSNGAFNVLVTPDHRMLYKQTRKVVSDTAIQKHLDLGWSRITNTQWVSPEFSEITADKAEFSRLTCLFNSANTTVTSEDFSALDALKIAYQADGLTKQRGNCILFHISKTRKKLRLEKLIKDLGFSYEKITYNGGVSYEYRINKGEIHFSKNFDWVLPLTRSSKWLQSFLEELEYWDGTHLDTDQNSFAYFSTDEKCIDVAQMAASLCGAYSRKENIGRKKEHHQDRFRLTISFFKSYICSSKVNKTEVKDYNGMVYCVEVPSNKIIVRRKGLTLICGNSRSGAATMYFPIFDPEIEVLVGLKNPLSVLANRVRDSDYGVSINKPFLKRAFTGKPFWLFSYKDNPELYEKFYHWDSETFDKELEQFAKDNPDKVTEVDAKQLLSTALTHRAETGRLYPHFADITNSHTPYKETIYSSNLCIAGDQLVPSNYGLLTAQELNELNTNLTLVDGQKEVKSSPMKLRESYQDVYKITLKNGMTHKVTNYHKIMTDKGLVKCEDLVPGVHKAKINVNEGIFGTKDMVDEAWLLGLWQGDGTSHKDLIFIDVWESKTECLKEEILEAYERVRTKYTGGYYTLRNGKSDKEIQKEYSKPQFNLCTKIGNKDKWRLQSNILSKYLNFEKNVIPRWVREGNKETQLAYIKGLFQTDGTYNYSANAHYLSITQTNKEFLEQLQILLNNLGYVFSLTKSKEGGERILPDSNRQPKLYNCKTSYRLVSGSFYTCLKFEEDTGFISFRGKFLPEPVKTVYKPKEYIKVVSVEYAGKEDVYCPTVESDEHLFVSHCFITRNCLEISNVTKPYKTHLELYSDNPEGVVGFCNLAGINLGVIKDDEEYERVCYYALFMIEQAIETATLPFPALNKNLKDYRSAGVGICSLAYLMAKNNKSYTTQEGRDFIFEQAERHQYFLTKAAIKLTEELGPCEAMSRNKYKDGWLPSDSTPKAVFDLVTVGFKYDWESLRERMKELGGLRFTTLSCLMPAESSSIAVSGTNSIFPLRDLTLVKTSGDTSNIWVAPEASRLAKKYEIVWDIPSEHIINLYALWQVFIDQAISADIFIDRTKNVNLSMSSMFKDLAQAAKLGVKTFYYMNTLTDKKDTFEFLNGIESEEEPSQNNEDVGCSSGGCTL